MEQLSRALNPDTVEGLVTRDIKAKRQIRVMLMIVICVGSFLAFSVWYNVNETLTNRSVGHHIQDDLQVASKERHDLQFIIKGLQGEIRECKIEIRLLRNQLADSAKTRTFGSKLLNK